MAQSLLWGGDGTSVTCRVCGEVSDGRLLLTVTSTVIGDLDARQCAGCGSVDLVDQPLEFANTDEVIDVYIEAGAGLGAMLGALAVVDHQRVRRLLEVGCGYGFSLDMASRLWGWEVTGVEPERSGRRGAAELGVRILAELPAPNPDTEHAFDLVFASEVVEHVPDPTAFLTDLRLRLAPDGLLLLTMPAAETIDPSTATHELLAALAPGYHSFVASTTGLSTLLHRAGFTEVRVVRQGSTLHAAAGCLALLSGTASEHSPAPRPDQAAALMGQYLDLRRVQRGEATALASGLTTRRLRNLVAAGDWARVPDALADANAVLAHRYGLTLDDIGSLGHHTPAQGDTLPITMAPLCFAAGMWALADDRPQAARDLFDTASATAQRRIAAGFGFLEFADLVRDGAHHAALAAAHFDPSDAVRRALTFDESGDRWRCRVFTAIVNAGVVDGGAHPDWTRLVEVVGAAAGVISTDEDPSVAKDGVDALYALGIDSLVAGAPDVALGWFQRCRDAALHGAAASLSAHLVPVAEEHLRIARTRLAETGTVAIHGGGGVTSSAGTLVTHHLQSYWCDASGTYLDGWVASAEGTAEAIGLRLGATLHAPLDRLPPGLVADDPRRTPFAVLATGAPHAQVTLVVRVVGERHDGELPSVRQVEIPLDLPDHGLPIRVPDPVASLSVERWIEDLAAPWIERAPPGPVLALGMRESPGAAEPLAQRLFGDREVVSIDIHPGPGVSLVADVHDLSTAIEPESFAIVYSVSVLEHLCLPWVAASQMARALAVGGLALQGAPWVFPTHSAPNDFWRISTDGLMALFGPEMGFEVLEAHSGPMVTVVPEPSWRTDQPLNLRMPTLASSSMSWVVARKVATTPEVVWPFDPETSRRVAEAYPIDGVISLDNQGSGTA